MFFRQALLATLLVSGTAAVAAAQTGEFPFRRFSAREWRPNRFFYRDSDRLRANADRMRLRDFDSRDMAMRMRNRAFAMRDEARRSQMEFRYRDDGRLRERMREQMRGHIDRFRFNRPGRFRWRSGAI